jgi:hypothetical protein
MGFAVLRRHGKSPSSHGQDASPQPRCGDAELSLRICDLGGTALAATGPRFPGAVPCRDDRGLDDPPTSPFRDAFGGWVLGSERFLARLRSLASSLQSNPPVAEARQLCGLDPKRIFDAVKSFYGLDETALLRRHDPHVARAVAAWLCRRHTEASLRELAPSLGLSRADSVPNLTRRIETRLKASPELSNDLAEILKRANSPDIGVNPNNAKRTNAARKSARSKTKNKG